MPRTLFLLLMLGGALCLGSAAQAQMQEEKINRILRPDESKSFDLSVQKKFGTTGFSSSTGKVIEAKTVTESRQYSIKNFLAGAFRSDKSFWMGDFKYSSTSEASTQPRHLFTLPEKNYNAKTVAMKSATGWEKKYDAANVPTRDFRGKEREKLNVPLTPEQAANNGYRGDLSELKSIDDVRALLNKSK
ncbi:MAG: hypothetical protein WCO68_09575 [Verrucomicrobiota bacterium]